jgi:tripartite-type tricarboxylate transporter receptor subunit TctC
MPKSCRNKPFVLTIVLAIGIVVSLVAAGGSQAAPYPVRPINIVVPYAAGGGTDTCARLLAAFATKKLGRPVNVVNVIGASGITGSMQVLNSAPDGYSLLMDGPSNTSFLAASRSDLPFKLEERTWLGQWLTDPMYYIYNAATPFKNLKEAMEFAKKNPQDYSWGAGSQASQAMFHGLTLLDDAGVDIPKTKMVVFPEGMAPSVQAVLAGTVMHASGYATDVVKILPTGKVKVLGVAAFQRTKQYPNVPTAKEQGFPTSTLIAWWGLSGPKGLPSEVVEAWTKLAQEAAKDQEFLANAEKQSKTLTPMGSKEQGEYVINESKSMARLAKKAGLVK